MNAFKCMMLSCLIVLLVMDAEQLLVWEVPLYMCCCYWLMNKEAAFGQRLNRSSQVEKARESGQSKGEAI